MSQTLFDADETPRQENLEDWLRLAFVALPSSRSLPVLQRWESPGALLKAALDRRDDELLATPGLTPANIERLRGEAKRDLAKPLAAMRDHGIRLLLRTDADYPAALAGLPDAPPYLFVRGDVLPQDAAAVAIVGTRNATDYGKGVAAQLAAELAQRGVTVVSGLARGVDTEAHRGALGVKGRTFAVCGCGLDIRYPSENWGLMAEIAGSGACFSEFAPTVQPESWHFPARNRIISGLSAGVIVVEAAEKSGALITAEFAMEQGREVFAVPGNIHRIQSRGAHALIKSGATLVENADDVINAINSRALPFENLREARSARLARLPDAVRADLSGVENRVFLALDVEPRHVDDIAASANMGAGEVNATLVMLELKGAARRLPGGMFFKSQLKNARDGARALLPLKKIMPKSLLIVESPAKVKTLKGFLGPDFTIKGSQGHVRDLPKSGIGVDIKNDFKPDYQPLEDRERIISELRKAAKEVDVVYLASDPDREGEAIAWHIRETLKIKNAKRIEFNEITKSAVQKALANPREIDMDRVDAQQARRVLDRIIGYKLSPLLARKVQKGASAGRVQSVALRLVCEREREIQAFKIEEYWSITTLLSPLTEEFPFPAKLITRGGDKLAVDNETDATALVEALRTESYRVAKVVRKEKKRNAAPPFITSTLQQEASRQIGFTAKRTMMVAQQLYEGIELGDGVPTGLITYMRTDSVAVAAEAQQAARELIGSRFGAEFLPDAPPVYKSRKSAQEAHEAIRPANVAVIPEEIERYLAPEQFKLYRLIWRRFVASQMKPAIMDTTSVDIAAGEFGLRASGSIIKFQGFLIVYEEAKDEDKSDEVEADDESADRKLPNLNEEQNLDLRDVLPRQHFTQPPPRYTEATLVRALEENGIGRPSTYASILSTIQDRGYANLETKRFFPTELGFTVNDKLVAHFPNVVDVQFTADIEEKLDGVEEGKQNWVDLLREFYTPFSLDLERANVEMEKVAPVETDFDCPACGKKLQLKRSRFGPFFSCSGYPECKTAMSVGPEGEPVEKAAKVAVEVEGIETGSTRECDQCKKPMVVRTSRRGPFWGCTGFPKCKNTVAIEGAVVQSAGAEGEPAPVRPTAILTDHLCPNCGEQLALRKGRFGPFLGCTGYPKCKTIINVDKEGAPRWPKEGEAAAPKKAAPKKAVRKKAA